MAVDSVDEGVSEGAGGGDARPAGPEPAEEPLGKRIGPPLGVGVVIIAIFLWILGAAIHSPQPHDVPLGIAGPTEAVAQVEKQLASKAPGAFDVTTYDNLDSARQALKDQDVYGVFAPGPEGPQLFLTGGTGSVPSEFLTKFFTQVSAQQGQELAVEDLAPVPDGDSRNTSSFVTMISLTLGALAFQVLLFFRARGVGLGVRLGVTVAYSVLAGLVGASVGVFVLDSFPGEFWSVAAVATLYSFTIAVVVAAFQTLGIPGIPLAALLLLPFGVATSGGVVDRYFLPDFYAMLSPGMPASAVVSAIRSVAYLDGAALSGPLLTLTVWAVLGLLVAIPAHLVKERRKAAAAA